MKKNLTFKTARTPKGEIFSKDNAKSHGKADACHGFLKQYFGKISVLERINPSVRPPLRRSRFSVYGFRDMRYEDYKNVAAHSEQASEPKDDLAEEVTELFKERFFFFGLVGDFVIKIVVA